MKVNTVSALPARLIGVALGLGPVLLAASTFLWRDGTYGVTGGALVAVAMVVWAYGLVGLYQALSERAPGFASLWLFVALAGVFAGVLFGARDFFEAAFAVPREVAMSQFAAYPIESGLLLFWSGPLFPLSLLILGIALARLRIAPLWVGVMICAGAVAFPLSRIPREPGLAHLTDLLLLVPFVYLAGRFWRAAGPFPVQP